MALISLIGPCDKCVQKKYSIPQVHRFWSNSKGKGNVRLYRESMRVMHAWTHMNINAPLGTHLYVWGWETLGWAYLSDFAMFFVLVLEIFLHPHFQIRPQVTLTTAASPMSRAVPAPWAPHSCSSLMLLSQSYSGKEIKEMAKEKSAGGI